MNLLVDWCRGVVVGRSWSVVGGVANHPTGHTEHRKKIQECLEISVTESQGVVGVVI